jgi:hypothetical protein
MGSANRRYGGGQRGCVVSQRRRVAVVVGVSAVAAIGVAVAVWLVVFNRQWVAYTNPRFDYHLDIPRNWTTKEMQDASITIVLTNPDTPSPEAIAVETQCYGNGKRLTAEAFWMQQQADGRQIRESAIGNVSLPSGLTAYKARGSGETSYEVYTLTHGEQACRLILQQATPPNQALANTILNSFRWE